MPAPVTAFFSLRRRLAPVTKLDVAIRVAMLVTIGVNLLYLAALALPGDPAPDVIDTWVSDIAEGVPVAVFWLVAVRTRFRRLEVLLASAAVTFNFAADVYYGLAADAEGYLPSPSPADVGYLLYYPLIGAAFVVTVVRQSRRVSRSVMLDVALAVLGAASVLSVLLGPVIGEAYEGKDALGDMIAALYPLCDLVLVAVIVGVAASPVLRVGPRAPFLVIGLLMFAGADVWYALLDQNGAYTAGTPLDLLWTAGVAFSAVWVVDIGRFPVVQPPPTARLAGILPLPAFAVLAGLAVLLHATQAEVPLLSLILAAATVALAAIPVMFRQANLARTLRLREQVVDRMVQLDKAKSDMIATVNHEMRTPLTSISGYLELVLDGDGGELPPAAAKMLGIAESSANRLHVLLEDMLLLTRLEAAGAHLEGPPVRMDEVVRRAVEAIRPLAATREVRIDVEGDQPVTVNGDAGQLERAISNLLDNAIKFTSASGSVSVVVDHAARMNGAAAVTVSVEDTGMGIPADELPSLFDRFFRASNARDAAVQGSGLGLPIVRGIVEAHGGAVSAESVLGEGTLMRITLPASPHPVAPDD
jgi:signal transduction histidine kinase